MGEMLPETRRPKTKPNRNSCHDCSCLEQKPS